LTFSVMFWMVRFFKTGAEWAPEPLEEAMLWNCESKGEMGWLHEQMSGWLVIVEQSRTGTVMSRHVTWGGRGGMKLRRPGWTCHRPTGYLAARVQCASSGS
jgi:hypothetical protein